MTLEVENLKRTTEQIQITKLYAAVNPRRSKDTVVVVQRKQQHYNNNVQYSNQMTRDYSSM